MSTAPATASSPQESPRSRLRSASVGTLFAVARQTSRLLRFRQNPQSRAAFRIVLGFAGAALVMLPLSYWNSWLAAIVGLAMFLAAILLPPAPSHSAIEEKVRELGAHVVVSGGKYQPGKAAPVPVRLFVCAEQICALDSHFQPLLVIPAVEISSADAKQVMDRWILQVRWPGHTAEFSYQGIFAERRARDAQTALAAVMPPQRPVLQKSRAAGA
jgi:hypothetical protein